MKYSEESRKLRDQIEELRERNHALDSKVRQVTKSRDKWKKKHDVLKRRVLSLANHLTKKGDDND